MPELDCPFPWFGGKARAAGIIWPRLGDTPNYVEPFAGSLAVLLQRPHWSDGAWADNARTHTETVNDLDGMLVNFWRSVIAAPDETAQWSSYPGTEEDLHARHLWLRDRLLDKTDLPKVALDYTEAKDVLPFAARLACDPVFYDPQVAGWWVWGMAYWIGHGWCDVDIEMWRKLPRLGDAGVGVARQRPHLQPRAVGQGVARQLPHLGDAGQGECERHVAALTEWFSALAGRLRHVDICCGDWRRVLGNSPTVHRGTPCAVVLDPPYSQDHGLDTVYAHHSRTVAADVHDWCIEHGDNPDLRIALCGYDTEHADLTARGWTVAAWKAQGGYSHIGDNSRGQDNCHRERIWFSPACLPVDVEPGLFGDDA